MPRRLSMRRRQAELWQPGDLPATHARCPTCLGLYALRHGCRWCASGGHARAQASVFRIQCAAAQYPYPRPQPHFRADGTVAIA